MLVGETVTVTQKTVVGHDEFNNAIYSEKKTDVGDVLVAPGTDSDVIESTRPDGTEVNYTLYFPKTFTGKLENELVKVRGEWLDVVGCPDRFDDSVCPTRWNMVVRVGVVHG